MLASFQLFAQVQERERPIGTPDFLSQDTARQALHLLQRGRPEKRANGSRVAMDLRLQADVRGSLPRLSDRYHPVTPDYRGF